MSKKKQKTKTGVQKIEPFCTYPELHEKVARLVGGTEPYILFNYDPDDNSHTHEGDTNVVGKFKCQNRNFRNEWSSGKIYTDIFMYPSNSYRAHVYNQRCMRCRKICKPVLDDSYEVRISRRLRIWRGDSVPELPSHEKSTAPHHIERCEACRIGKCQAAKSIERLMKRMTL